MTGRPEEGQEIAVWPDHWPRTPREIATATADALAAARSESAEPFDEAVAVLVDLPYEQVTAVHAGMVRELLEELHPDGLAGEDVQAVLERSVRSGLRWLPSLEPEAVVAVLTGALGVSDSDAERPKIRPEQYLAAGLLVVADLVAARRVASEAYLRRAVSEIERAETQEMP
ncbi:hypothetical protein LSF60_03175 [Rhodococcus pyridinivorans]|uniref:hypothetical protein n=1 Tax=Rhodococcus pyridinivorans TaxID=103816 RepID=UPI001E43E92F|nr:hypothetical protein [Rhodococcus pyridinivorans]UGQ58560.1 hypothetical protein LSF60_03175 [Rhodococcus pyridinivorans]